MIATPKMVEEALADHPPSGYDPKEPLRRFPSDFGQGNGVWARAGDVWKKGTVQYVEGAQVCFVLDGEQEERRCAYNSGKIWPFYA